ncbi:hypothetical protein Btru_078087 [Bulinus truncatus]|nr:hypothetical protein Btru_078087 [Bulinus truncatus]
MDSIEKNEFSVSCICLCVRCKHFIQTIMFKRHQLLLTANHDFLVNEIPMDETLKAIREKNILSWHDFEQLKTLRHQGRKALARYFLAVLPHRGQRAFQAFLESLQEANAQHLVELLLQQAGAVNMEDLFKSPDPTSTPQTPSIGLRLRSRRAVFGQPAVLLWWSNTAPRVAGRNQLSL